MLVHICTSRVQLCNSALSGVINGHLATTLPDQVVSALCSESIAAGVSVLLPFKLGISDQSVSSGGKL